METTELRIETGARLVTDISSQVAGFCRDLGDGLLNVFVPHATAGVALMETGRTHQIRVHFSALRHPCVGDLTYGADPTLAARLGVSRQWLHAVRLGFPHPADGRWMEFTSPYPDDLAGALTLLREP